MSKDIILLIIFVLMFIAFITVDSKCKILHEEITIIQHEIYKLKEKNENS